MRRPPWPQLVAACVALVGVVLITLGALLATIWRAPTTSTVRVVAADGVPAVVTAPGALALDGPSVRVEAFADTSTQKVFLGVARTPDVVAFLGDAAHQTLTGITAGGAAVVTRDGTSAELPDPARSDIWVAGVAGQGSAGLTWPEQPGSWTLVAATDGSASPQVVTFTWRLQSRTSLAPAVIALGVLLLVSGVVALAMLVARAREEADL